MLVCARHKQLQKCHCQRQLPSSTCVCTNAFTSGQARDCALQLMSLQFIEITAPSQALLQEGITCKPQGPSMVTCFLRWYKQVTLLLPTPTKHPIETLGHLGSCVAFSFCLQILIEPKQSSFTPFKPYSFRDGRICAAEGKKKTPLRAYILFSAAYSLFSLLTNFTYVTSVLSRRQTHSFEEGGKKNNPKSHLEILGRYQD